MNTLNLVKQKPAAAPLPSTTKSSHRPKNVQLQDETEKCDLKHRTRKRKPHRRRRKEDRDAKQDETENAN
ncbi:hypothetical protein QL285_068332 [Trifolium repens]|nr:hypothetical protein QL285_068332 [Trifolium repens]